MAQIKTFTDLQQSKKLAEILPLESADMYWFRQIDSDYFPPNVESIYPMPLFKDGKEDFNYDTPCWSLSSLLSILPFHLIVDNKRYAFSMIKGLDKNGETHAIKYVIFNTTFYLHLTDFYNNPIDACYEMIIRLNELKLL